MPSIGKQEHARQSQTSAREASIATENLESSKDTTDENDDNDPWKAVMGGSVRGLLLMLFKKISLKAVLKKKAFLTIGGTAESGTESNFVSKKMKTSFLHSRAVVYAETSMMGMVVFGTYEATLKYLERRKEYNIGETPVIVHAGSGMSAGVARSIFWMGWEKAVHKKKWIQEHPWFCVRTTIHHAIGYGALFGSYQGMRQSLVSVDPLSIISDGATAVLKEMNDSSEESVWNPSSVTDSIPFAYTVVAGGIAGQVHHVLNHYTSHWKQFRTKIPPLPRFHPTISSFGTMALCFAAFEHGPNAVEGMMGSVNKTIEALEKKIER